jgi:hypothetical protein
MIRYGEGSDLIEVKIKDCRGRVLEKWVCNTNDAKTYERMVNHISKKYGFNIVFEPNLNEFINDTKDVF